MSSRGAQVAFSLDHKKLRRFRIRCMKDGVIAESGTHADLMDLGGEYAKLYDIQANAFRGDESGVYTF